MITITATSLEDVEYLPDTLGCKAVDATTITSAYENDEDSFGCELEPQWVVLINPAEDISIPTYLCTIHFNAFKYALKSGPVGVDIDVFGEPY